jgi:hypothetical protein
MFADIGIGNFLLLIPARDILKVIHGHTFDQWLWLAIHIHHIFSHSHNHKNMLKANELILLTPREISTFWIGMYPVSAGYKYELQQIQHKSHFNILK